LSAVEVVGVKVKTTSMVTALVVEALVVTFL
jgi:hypothetical protein